jgi:putative oxidoreductase
MKTLNDILSAIGRFLQPLILLGIRLYWGWQFFETGKGKLTHLDRITAFFTSLNIPAPHLNAILSGSVETAGGLLLVVGLFSRIVTLPLMFILALAYATADSDALHAIFSDPDKFLSATPFLFLFASLIIFAFGPGCLSLDRLFDKNAD